MPPRFTSSDEAAHHLDAALDSLVQARVALADPSPTTWSPPTLALLTATEDDPEWNRHTARLREVLARLEGMAPELEPHLYEAKLAAQDLAERAAAVGFGVGLSLAVGERTGSPDDTDGNRQIR